MVEADAKLSILDILVRKNGNSMKHYNTGIECT